MFCYFPASLPRFSFPSSLKGASADRDDERLINNKDFVHFFVGEGEGRYNLVTQVTNCGK